MFLTPIPGVYFALCLSLMVISLLETIFIIHLSHMATTQPPPMPWWLHSLLLNCASPRKCCTTAPGKGNKGLGLTLTHLHGKGSQHRLHFLFPHLHSFTLSFLPVSLAPQVNSMAHGWVSVSL